MLAERLIWGKKRVGVTHILEMCLLGFGARAAVDAHLARRHFGEIIGNNTTETRFDRNTHSNTVLENGIVRSELVGFVGHVLNGLIISPLMWMPRFERIRGPMFAFELRVFADAKKSQKRPARKHPKLCIN